MPWSVLPFLQLYPRNRESQPLFAGVLEFEFALGYLSRRNILARRLSGIFPQCAIKIAYRPQCQLQSLGICGLSCFDFGF